MALDEAKPYSKDAQVARGPKRPSRMKASAKRWAEIAERKQGPCRGCGRRPPNQMAHLLGRGQGAPDSEWNVVPLCGPFYNGCHDLFDGRDPDVCRKVAESLTDQEYAGLIEWAGEGVIERRFGVRYLRA